MPGAGKLNQLIHILKPRAVRNQDTGQDEIKFNRHHRKQPAMIEEVSGGVTRRGNQVESNVTSVITIRHIDGIGSDYRVEKYVEGGEGAQLDIVRAIDRDGKREWLELQCSEVV